MHRKIFKTGNSLVVSIPKEIIEYLQLGEGAKVNVSLDRGKRQIVITPLDSTTPIASIEPAFAKQITEFIEQYRSALEELAR